MKSLWTAAALGSPFRRDSSANLGAAPALSAKTLLAGHLHSIATVPDLGATLCAVIVVREERYESTVTRYGADWLDLCLPLGALGNLDERVGAYPFEEEAVSKGWREPIERWFATIASAVFEDVPYEHAVTGHEVSGVEPFEVRRGSLGVFTRTPDGTLNVDPVRDWSL